jgi:hypothetical protein
MGESPHLRHRRHKLHIACGDFFYPFIESRPALIALLLLSPKSLRFSGTPIFVFAVKIGIQTGQFEE